MKQIQLHCTGGFIIALTFEALGSVLGAISIPYSLIELWGISRVIAGCGTGMSMGLLTVFVQECPSTNIRGACACFQVCIHAATTTFVGTVSMCRRYSWHITWHGHVFG